MTGSVKTRGVPNWNRMASVWMEILAKRAGANVTEVVVKERKNENKN